MLMPVAVVDGVESAGIGSGAEMAGIGSGVGSAVSVVARLLLNRLGFSN